MIDTVILIIPISRCWITDPHKFTPPAIGIQENKAVFCKYVNNPSKEAKERGIYQPKLTIIKRGKSGELKAEFSVPKLKFNNNLDEVVETDFDEVVEILQKRLEEMGVKVWKIHIEGAKVSSFHASKNILLTQGYTAIFAIRELGKINLNLKLDLERKDYRNNGESLQFYSNRHALVFYDKIRDLNKPANRAIDKNQTKQQFSIFDQIKKQREKIEVLKMEARLSHRAKMKEILAEIGFLEEPIFKNIFKKDICQKVLNLYWGKFFQKDKFLFCVKNNPQKLLQLIFRKYPNTKPKTAVLLAGLMTLCKDDEGIRGLRTITNSKNWTPLRNYLRKFEDEIFTQPAHGFIKDIQRSLDSFEPYKITKLNEKYN